LVQNFYGLGSGTGSGSGPSKFKKSDPDPKKLSGSATLPRTNANVDNCFVVGMTTWLQKTRVVDPDSFESGSSLFSQSRSGLDPVLDSDPDSVWIRIGIWFGSGSGLTIKAGSGSGSGFK
jgi:hypothetical protein